VAKKKNSRPNLRSCLVIALVAGTFLALNRMAPLPSRVKELTRLEFDAALEQGLVEEPVIRVVDREDGSTRLVGELKTGEKTPDGKEAKAEFLLPLVPGENEELMASLRARGMPVKVVEKRAALSPFMVQLLFFILMLGAFYWFFARKMGGENGPFAFGKSRAKVLNGKEDKRKVTFADVAGIDEAREEVQEIVEFLKKPDDFRKLGGRIPKGVLLVGPPGTGKTLLAATSRRCSSASARAACATCSRRRRRKRPASSSSTRSTPSA